MEREKTKEKQRKNNGGMKGQHVERVTQPCPRISPSASTAFRSPGEDEALRGRGHNGHTRRRGSALDHRARIGKVGVSASPHDL